MQNYYQVLGIHTAAEDIVVKAAYRVLVQKYHPDKWREEPAFAHSKMAELNEAYAVLSDPVLRRNYDVKIGTDDYVNSEYQEDLNQGFDNEISDAWSIALDFYPKIEECYRELRRVNVMLANSFKLYLVENQIFSKCEVISKEMEGNFLRRYFGSDKKILKIVKELILAGDRDAVRKINKYVRIMGKDVSADDILSKIQTVLGGNPSNFYTFTEDIFKDHQILKLMKRILNISNPANEAVSLLRLLKCEVRSGYFDAKWMWQFKFNGESFLLTPDQLIEFTREEICKKVLNN